jgi:shikimate kinase
MKRIFLIGYMGTGKTTIGHELAKALNLEFIDLDHYIQARYQKTVGQLFEEVGETGFREIEKRVLREVGEFDDVVISAGGGTPCFFDNMDYMKLVGKTVYLKASPDALAKRLSTCKDKRPLIKDKSEEELLSFIEDSLQKREVYYSSAHLVFDTEELMSEDDVYRFVEKLIDILKSHEISH